MKPQRDLPDAWAKRMVNLGLSYRGKPSARALADRAGVTVGATLRVIFRENYGEDTALALGQALRDPGFVADWVAIPLGEEYLPPAASRMLTPQQRVLVDELIRELARKERDDAGNADAQKRPDRAPAPGDAPDMLDVRDEAIRIAIQENSALAARHGHEAGKMNPAGEAQKLAGEDDQDDGGEDPA